MGEYLAPDKLGLFLYLCAPGLVLVYFRSTFLTGRMPTGSEAVLTYVTLSVIYQAALLPFTNLTIDKSLGARLPTIAWCGIIFVAPAIAGALLGLNARHQWLRSVLRRMRLNTVHPVETAWDWRFGRCTECYVLITLKNGIKWAGLLSANSFLSTSPTERDVFLEQVYDWKNQDKWSPTGSGVWLAGADIQSIEQWPKRKLHDRQRSRKVRWWRRADRKRPSTNS